MNNSRLPADWLASIVMSNPISRLDNGNIRTCPVRLCFTDYLLKPQTGQKNDDGSEKKPSFNVTILFPASATPQVNDVMWRAWNELAREKFPQNIGSDGNMFGLHWPVHDQGTKQQYSGFTPGALFLNASTEYKPQVVDAAMNPLVDDSRVYAGVWALVSLNTYAYGTQKGAKKKGVGFGLSSIMLIADDEKLSGGAPDAKQEFAGVKVDSRFMAAGQFGQAAAPGVVPASAPPAYGAPPGYGAPPRASAPPAIVSLDDLL